MRLSIILAPGPPFAYNHTMTSPPAAAADPFEPERRARVFYLFTVLAMLVYGGMVCPFIEDMHIMAWLGILLAVYAPVFFLRRLAEPRYVLPAQPWARAGRQFKLDFGLAVLAGLGLAAVNGALYQYPLESHGKVLVGAAALGFFAALDLAIARERGVAMDALAKGLSAVTIREFSSMTRKFSLLATAMLVVVTSVVMMLVVKDMVHIHEHEGMADLDAVVVGTVIEIAFVSGVMLVLTLTVVRGYAGILKLFFGMQTEALERVRRGELDVGVPVVSNDEFGAIAEHTNRMIEGLKEKQRIQTVLGKVVDPEVAAMLTAEGPDALKLGGSRHELVVLFSDIRDFTTWAEGSEPEDLVAGLNTYFTRMVELVHAHGGTVDKFIGDGMLAVFGLRPGGGDTSEAPADAAVAAAREMVAETARLGTDLGRELAIGVGLHRGQVISGLVGSPERLEFTVIGDAVNTAARLERVTRQAGVGVVASRTLYAGLSEALQGLAWKDLGPQALKGRREPVEALGLD